MGALKALYPNKESDIVREYGEMWSKITSIPVSLDSGFSIHRERDVFVL
jgi:hypothetical protein